MRATAAPVVSMRAVSSLFTRGASAQPAGAMLPAAGGNAMFARLLATADTAPQTGADVAERINALRGGGNPLPAALRADVEGRFGQPLGDVRVHDDGEAAALATRLGARAFTSGQDIFFNAGEYRPSTPDGYELLTHELTHTLQQSTGAVQGRAAAPGLLVSEPQDRDEQVAYATARRLRAEWESGDAGPRPHGAPGHHAIAAGRADPPGPAAPVVQRAAEGPVEVARDGAGETSLLDDLVPDFILDGVKAAVSAIPGYTMLSQVIGTDPIIHRPVRAGAEELVESVLTFGPFGEATGRLLRGIDVIDDVLDAVQTRLTAHHLTLNRITDEIGKACDELSVTAGIDGNVATVRRHVDALLADARAAVSELVDQVIQVVRSVIAEVAEPLLQRPEVRPVWELAKKVLHHDPLHGTPVTAPTVEILADFLTLIGREQTLEQLRERGTLQQAADWLDTQFATFAGVKDELVQLFADAWQAIQPQNLPRLLDTLPGLAARAVALVRRIAAFAATIMGKAVELVKQSLLGPLSERARHITGFPLLTVVIGQDPFTGQRVPRTAENLIRGFVTLLPGGDATYDQLAESGVIGQAAARIEGEMGRLGISADLVVTTFRGIWDSLSLDDLLDPVGAFQRILRQFGEPVSRLVEFAGVVLEVVVTLIIKLMNFPSDLVGDIIGNAMSAIEDIKRDPVRFLLNMLQALKTGFLGFLDGIGTYLLQGLSSWLLRGLGQLGITLPRELTPGAALDLAMQVLGVGAETLWQKLGERIGPERVAQLRAGIDHLTGAWAFLKDVRERGVAAVYEYVADKLSGLWDTVLRMATDWIMTQVVRRATAKLVSMLDPTGVMAVVNSCVAFFNAVQSAIEYVRDILRIVEQYTRTIAQVARGDIQPGADRVTRGLADAVPIAIGFLANQVGIGNVPEKVVDIIKGLRELVDRALDWLFDQAMRLGAAALNALSGGGSPAQGDRTKAPPRPGELQLTDLAITETFTLGSEGHSLTGDADPLHLTVRSHPVAITRLIALNPGTTLGADYDAYVKAVNDYKAKLDERDEEQDETLRAALERQLATRLTAVRNSVEKLVITILPLKGFTPDIPGLSAPGVGVQGRHGSKVSSLRGGNKIWWTESEHIVPFDLGRTFWAAATVDVPGRDGWEDDNQVTLMIYEDAAAKKTDETDPMTGLDEREISAAFAAAVAASGISRDLDASSIRNSHTNLAGRRQNRVSVEVATPLIHKIENMLDRAQMVHEMRTNWAIAHCHGHIESGYTISNGQRRGESAPTPSPDQVSRAADAQVAGLTRLVTRAVLLDLQKKLSNPS